ncbi:DUF3011 domain-containing protein [Geminocystis sp. CENA526]|uniref:DUF3011 domain-containing protein n=1 Tax=Geminocystis sp. CENA526 TaxID=1355871 RepID=UPI003D6FFA46
MKNLHTLALISAISVGFFAQANPAAAQNRIVCESFRGRYNFCNVDTRGGVRFVRQLSNASCRQGSTWGYDRNGIWVDQGCSAEFAVRDTGWNNNNNNWNNNNNNTGGNDTAAIIGGVLAVGAIAAAIASGSGNSSSDGTITCGSERGNYTRCPVDIRRNDRVVLRRQLSNAGCWEGNTWGYDRNGIWVDQGCRGQFEVR